MSYEENIADNKALCEGCPMSEGCPICVIRKPRVSITIKWRGAELDDDTDRETKNTSMR